METNDTLYDFLDKKEKDNVDNADKLEEEKRMALLDSQYRAAVCINKYNVGTTKAYYYYRYFIANVLPMLIKDCINSYNDVFNINDVNKQKAFDYELQVASNDEGETKFNKVKNFFFISFGDFIIYEEFINYLNMFCLRNNIGYINKFSSYYIYRFNSKTIGDILNAYYSELQRFEHTDNLIASIQVEENTNVNGKELTKNIKIR